MNHPLHDVIIVGGGIVGTYCAYEFASHGLKTLLLERQELAAGASSRGGGLLLKGATDVYAAEVVPHLLTNQHLLEEFIQRHNAEVDYVREGSLFVCFEEDAASTQTLMEEMNAAGLPSEWWSPRELQDRLPALTRRAVGGRFIPSDAQLTPWRLCTSFAKAACETGADIRTHQNVLSFLRDSNHQVIGVQTDQESFYSRQIVLATNAYTGHLIPELKSIIIPTRGQAFLTFPVQPSFLFACASNQDLEYWRQTREGNILFGGCRRFEDLCPEGKGTESTESTETVQRALISTFNALFPEWSPVSMERAWGGTMGFTPDFRPLIGRWDGEPDILLAAGFSGNGLPLVCVCGQMLRELILEGATRLPMMPYDPNRFHSSQGTGGRAEFP